ncbi:hypothetical protein A3F58_00040 [Candidatus Roizmanbacteria bacterium RIFCSPHIGHO2_12_FULL_37_9b]|nr:MAG: hypothetical protein A3F58_00040 [Candidatus Roizmanbacteria bacterium RIFCSPHIGHO2_12_FULL_37_9b]
MIIAGWGKKSKKIADAGLHKCSNCKNIATFEIREMANYASAYFIKIAKWNKQTYLVCTICNAGFELTDEGKNELLKATIELPSNSDIVDIWNNINKLFVEYINNKKDINKWNEYALNEMSKKNYNKSSIEYVLTNYNNNLIDTSKTEQ